MMRSGATNKCTPMEVSHRGQYLGHSLDNYWHYAYFTRRIFYSNGPRVFYGKRKVLNALYNRFLYFIKCNQSTRRRIQIMVHLIKITNWLFCNKGRWVGKTLTFVVPMSVLKNGPNGEVINVYDNLWVYFVRLLKVIHVNYTLFKS